MGRCVVFKALFNIILDLLATIVQLVCFPINAAITAAFPDISSMLLQVTDNIGNIFGNFSWIVNILPSIFFEFLLFIITVEIAKYTAYVSIHGIIKVWNLFQKLKFW